MSHRVTLKDVAAVAGVSVAAVSLVLNGKPNRLSEARRRQILQAAESLHYVPNQNARSLVTRRSMLVALVVPDIENMFFAAFAKALDERCRADGYSLIVANSDDGRDREHALLERLESRGVDGLMLIPARESTGMVDVLRDDVLRMSCPVTVVDRLLDVRWCDTVGSDNYRGGMLAGNALLQQGHRRVACISAADLSNSASDRREGFLGALRSAGLALDPELDIVGDYRFDSGFAAADRLVEHGATAVFCCNDLMALGCMMRFVQRGVSVPCDCSVIGYDNVIHRRLGLAPTLATVDQHIDILADRAYALMRRRMDEPQSERYWFSEPEHIVVKPSLVERESVGAVATDR